MKTPSHTRSAPSKTDAAVARAARDVRKSFARRRAPGDLDDVEQDAALAALEALASGNVDPRSPTLPGYLRSVARRAAGVGVSRELAVVSFPRKRAKQARDWQHRVPVLGCGYGEDREDEPSEVVALVSYDTPETVSAEAAAARAGANAVARLGAVIVRHARTLPPGHRVVAEVVLGLRPGTKPARTFREVAWRTGVTVSRARAVVKKLAKKVLADVGPMRDDRG